GAPRSVPVTTPRSAFDDNEVRLRIFLADHFRGLIFRTLVARFRGGKILEFHHDVAVARGAFHRVEGTATHDEVGAVLFECGFRRGEIFRIALPIVHGDAHHPIT